MLCVKARRESPEKADKTSGQEYQNQCKGKDQWQLHVSSYKIIPINANTFLWHFCKINIPIIFLQNAKDWH